MFISTVLYAVTNFYNYYCIIYCSLYVQSYAGAGCVVHEQADTEAEVAASASAPVGDAAGDDGTVDSDGDFAAAAVAAASNGDIAAPFVVTDPASPGAGAGDGDTGATTVSVNFYCTLCGYDFPLQCFTVIKYTGTR